MIAAVEPSSLRLAMIAWAAVAPRASPLTTAGSDRSRPASPVTYVLLMLFSTLAMIVGLPAGGGHFPKWTGKDAVHHVIAGRQCCCVGGDARDCIAGIGIWPIGEASCGIDC